VNFAFLIIPRSRTFPVADYPIAAIIVLTDDTRACNAVSFPLSEITRRSGNDVLRRNPRKRPIIYGN